MGKINPRLKSRKKAPRWRKGQSSSCNPETRKYRNQVKSRFFQFNLESNRLTTDAVKKLDALHGIESEKIEIDDDDDGETETFKTFGTFASDYSNCSNISFSRFLNHFQSSSFIHKEMLAILAAVTEIIKQNGGSETSTEYYAALMTTLEECDSEESVAAVLSLLGMGLKTVPKNVLKLQFSQASQVFYQILSKYAASDNFLIIRHSIGCLSFLFRIQEPAVWNISSTLKILDGILEFTFHSKPKVRKAAQHSICAILNGSDLMIGDNPPIYHPAAPHISKFCLKMFDNAGQPGTITTTLHLLTLLKDIVYSLPKSFVKNICESLLKIMTLNNTLITSCCLQTFHSLFVSKPPDVILPSELNAQIINALYDYQPAPGDIQPTLAWLAVMQEAHINLAVHSLYLCAMNLPKFVEKSMELWLSDKTEVITAASHSIKVIIQLCIKPMCDDGVEKYNSSIVKVIETLGMGIKYQYNAVWHHVLHLIAVLFQSVGAFYQNELAPILQELAELRDSHKFIYNSEVEYAVGAAIKTIGPEIVLKKIPLTRNNTEINLQRSWLLPVLKDCITSGSLSYFFNSLMPLALMCERRSKDLKAKNEIIASHSYELLNVQLWALLPSFCNNAKDVKASFKNIAKILGVAISEKNDLRLSIMAALRKLIVKSVENKNQQDIEELARFAKNFLPLLFNLYTTKSNGTDEEGQRLSAFDTIKVYLTITPPSLYEELFDKAIEKLDEKNTDDFVKQSIFDLIRILTQYTDPKRLQSLYQRCLSIIMLDKQPKEQKKAYRFLEEICGNNSQVCKTFISNNRLTIQKSLIKAALKVCTPSKGARLRCLEHLIKSNPEIKMDKFLTSVIPEMILATKDLNEKCRKSAYQLMDTIAIKSLEHADIFNDYIQLIVAGLGGAPTYISTTLLALANLIFKYNGMIGIQTAQEILNHVCTLVTSPSREIVLAVLSYLKVYLSSFPLAIIGPNLEGIINGFSAMSEDCKRHFRQKIRDILVKMVRKFGFQVINEMVPKSDEIMQKRLKNIKKIEMRKQKVKEEKDLLRKSNDNNDDNDESEFNIKKKPKSIEEILADSDDDDDEEFDDTSDKSTKKSFKRQTWIKESVDSITDFADPSSIKNITATKPDEIISNSFKSKQKDHGFKSTPDGRLIIKDSSDDDSENMEEKKKKKKKKLPYMEDSEDNYKDEDSEDDEMSVISMKKQKRKRKFSDSDTVSVNSSKYKAGGCGIHRPIKNFKVENKTPGAEFKSKKATGDVKRKGKPDPYAYLPLTRASLNRRKKLKNAGRFKNIISGTKKGDKGAGSKLKKKKI